MSHGHSWLQFSHTGSSIAPVCLCRSIRQFKVTNRCLRTVSAVSSGCVSMWSVNHACQVVRLFGRARCRLRWRSGSTPARTVVWRQSCRSVCGGWLVGGSDSSSCRRPSRMALWASVKPACAACWWCWAWLPGGNPLVGLDNPASYSCDGFSAVLMCVV